MPKGYEGIVIIEYGKEDGQEEKRIGSFLGIGGSRIIKTDKNGYAKTQTKSHDTSTPIFNISSRNADLEDTKIHYEDT